MRKITALLAAAGMVAAMSGVAMAAGENSANATASSTATVVTPIGISKSIDMNFGKIVPGATIGTVVLATTSARSVTGGTTLGNSPGVAASFAVTGQADATYAISLPGSAITLTTGTSETMTADTFTSNPSGTGTLSGGAQTLLVGATLHVNTAALNPAGTYTNASDLSVTVNYN